MIKVVRRTSTDRVESVHGQTSRDELLKFQKVNPNSECRCDERLKTKVEESTRLSDTGLSGELEHLKSSQFPDDPVRIKVQQMIIL